MAGFPTGRRLDAGLVPRQLAEATGSLLTVDGPCPGGQVGAAYVRWPGGRRAVLTIRPPGALDLYTLRFDLARRAPGLGRRLATLSVGAVWAAGSLVMTILVTALEVLVQFLQDFIFTTLTATCLAGALQVGLSRPEP